MIGAVDRPPRPSLLRSRAGEAAIFALPLVIFLFLLYAMLGWTFYTSVSNWQGTAANYSFGGLKWYRLMFSLDRFWVDIGNNLRWITIGVVPTVVAAVLLAYLLEIGTIKGVEPYLRTLILYPAAMSFIVTGTIWSWMYQPDRGVLNTILRGVGLGSIASGYTTDPDSATSG